MGEESTTEGGYNAGLGYTYEVGSGGSQVYIDVRYHWIDTPRARTEYVPVVIGYRW